MTHTALAGYCFTPLTEPLVDVRKHKLFFTKRACTGRIYISDEGINIQASGPQQDMSDYQEWLKSDPRFKEILFNIDSVKENIFPRMTIKYRPQLVALDVKVDLSKRGHYLSPAEFCEAMKKQEGLLIDVRNSYETAIGHFENAQLPIQQHYREFPAYAADLKKYLDVKTPILMCCTGGIRCELFSALLIKLGFEKVYQLKGGLLNYGSTVGDALWKGKVFVFDDRMAVPIQGSASCKEETVIGRCLCDTPSDVYYNCANMNCNTLFLSCPSCLEKRKGCCSELCMQSKRLRPFDAREGNKPFRRKHLWMKEKNLLPCACSDGP